MPGWKLHQNSLGFGRSERSLLLLRRGVVGVFLRLWGFVFFFPSLLIDLSLVCLENNFKHKSIKIAALI